MKNVVCGPCGFLLDGESGKQIKCNAWVKSVICLHSTMTQHVVTCCNVWDESNQQQCPVINWYPMNGHVSQLKTSVNAALVYCQRSSLLRAQMKALGRLQDGGLFSICLSPSLPKDVASQSRCWLQSGVARFLAMTRRWADSNRWVP